MFLSLLSPAQNMVKKYNAEMKVQKKTLSGILVQTTTDSTNRFVFVSKLGLKFFDIEVGKTNFNYTIHYFSPAFKTHKRVIGVAKEMFVLGYDIPKWSENNGKIKLSKSEKGACKTGFGIFGKRVKVCTLNENVTAKCKFYPVSFNFKIME